MGLASWWDAMKDFEKRIGKLFAKNYYLIPSDGKLFKEIITKMSEPYKNIKFDKVIGLETRGFFYGPVIAERLGKGFIPVFKKGKIENPISTDCYIDHSGTEKCLEMITDSIEKNEKVIIVDDWFETGKTGKAIVNLIEKLGGKIVGISIIYNQMSQKDEDFFKQYNLHYLLKR